VTAAALRWMPAKAYGGLFKPPAAAFVVIHCTESDNGAGTAESLAGPNWFGGPAGTSAHRMFDRDSGVEMVRRTLVAFHAGPQGNTWGRSYEFCGRASWSAAKWREPAQLQMLRLAAPHIADDLIEITGSRASALAAARWLSLVQVFRKDHGLCTHNDIRLALGGTTHSDPGPNFPYAELLAMVRAELGEQPVGDAVADDHRTPLEDDVPTATILPGQSICLPATTKDTDLLVACDNPTRATVKLAGPDGPDTLIEGADLRVAVQRADRTWHPVGRPGFPINGVEPLLTAVPLGVTGCHLNGTGAKDDMGHGQVLGVSVLNTGHVPVTVTLAPHPLS